MRRPAYFFCGMATILLLLAAPATPARARASAIAGTIALVVSCATNPERTTITNSTDETLVLTGFQLMSVINRRPGVPPIRLSGTLAVGAALVIETGSNAPATAPTREFMYGDDDPNEGARLGTPYGTLTVLCSVGAGVLPVSGGGPPTVTPAPTGTPRPTSTVIAPTSAPPMPGLPNTGMGGGISTPLGSGGLALLLVLIALGYARVVRHRHPR